MLFVASFWAIAIADTIESIPPRRAPAASAAIGSRRRAGLREARRFGRHHNGGEFSSGCHTFHGIGPRARRPRACGPCYIG